MTDLSVPTVGAPAVTTASIPNSSPSLTQAGSKVQVSITKEYRFEAAHRLPFHDGKCKNLHGHNYRVAVTMVGGLHAGESSNSGMVEDFAKVEKDIQRVIGYYDHTYLNDFMENPTAEKLAYSFLTGFNALDARYQSVTVWETDDCSATARITS